MHQLCCATVLARSSLRIALVLASLHFSHDAGHASAQAPSSDYKAAIDAAVEEYAEGHWEESLALFTRAHALSPSARTLRGLGLASFEMRHYSDAITYLSSSLTDTRKPLTSEQKRDTSALIYRANAFVARVQILLSPATASLSLDGRVIEGSGDRTLLLDSGAHQLIASAPGYELAVRNVDWSPGTQAELELRLVEAPSSKLDQVDAPAARGAQPSTPPPAVSSAPSRQFTALTYSMLAGSVGALALASTATFMREHRARQLVEQCQGYLPDNEQRCKEMLKSGRVWLALAISSGALSGILTAVTIGLWRASPADDSATARALDACQLGAGRTTAVHCSLRF